MAYKVRVTPTGTELDVEIPSKLRYATVAELTDLLVAAGWQPQEWDEPGSTSWSNGKMSVVLPPERTTQNYEEYIRDTQLMDIALGRIMKSVDLMHVYYQGELRSLVASLRDIYSDVDMSSARYSASMALIESREGFE